MAGFQSKRATPIRLRPQGGDKQIAGRGPREQARQWFDIALRLEQGGALAAAAAALEESLRLAPENPSALNNLAWILATANDVTVRNGPRARQLAKRALQLLPQAYWAKGTLAAAEAELGNYAEALSQLEEAVREARARGDVSFVRAPCPPRTYERGYRVPSTSLRTAPPSGDGAQALTGAQKGSPAASGTTLPGVTPT